MAGRDGPSVVQSKHTTFINQARFLRWAWFVSRKTITTITSKISDHRNKQSNSKYLKNYQSVTVSQCEQMLLGKRGQQTGQRQG